MSPDVESLYRPHLSEADRRLLSALPSAGAGLIAQLGDPATEMAVFGRSRFSPSGPGDAGLAGPGTWTVPGPGSPGPVTGPLRPVTGGPGDLSDATPFLVFATAVHRTAARLATATYVEEAWMPRRRIPVFDVRPLRELLAGPAHRFFLVELLASYTHVSSGATWQRTARGWRRRRFSELDPVSLAGLLETVDPVERPGVYRRLGDLALFLTGVFPDHRGTADLDGVAAARLLRASGLRPADADDLAGVELLAELGRRWYALAARGVVALGGPMTAGLSVAREMGERFADARRILNVVTDWYLFPLRGRWFGHP